MRVRRCGWGGALGQPRVIDNIAITADIVSQHKSGMCSE